MSGVSGLIFKISAGNTKSPNRAMLKQMYGDWRIAFTKTPPRALTND
jgi:hypothetical protein